MITIEKIQSAQKEAAKAMVPRMARVLWSASDKFVRNYSDSPTAELIEPICNLFRSRRLIVFRPPQNRADPGFQEIADHQVNRRTAGLRLSTLTGEHLAVSPLDITSVYLRAEARFAVPAEHHPRGVLGVFAHIHYVACWMEFGNKDKWRNCWSSPR